VDVYTDLVHLVCQDLDNLHKFAQRIGLKREWFQDHPKHPHYDLMGRMVNRAVKAGAIVVSSREIVTLLRI